jgi:hypothetical protein
VIKLKGRCLCRAVTYEIDGPIIWCGHCHCESCRRATSSPFTTFIRVKLKDIHFTGAAPKVYASTPPVRRTFCGACGSPISYQHDERPEEIDILALTLEHPEAVSPADHDFAEEMLPWIHLNDGLPLKPGA